MTDLQRKLKGRWGRKFKDKRNWKTYNEELVKRGEYLLDMEFIENWDAELETMNQGKEGARYKYPNTLIELQAVWHAKRMPVRMIEGMTRDLVKMGSLPAYNDYSTVSRRINRLEYKLSLPEGDNIVFFSDGTSLQAVSGGEYLREKYGKKNRRWIQIILLGDTEHHEPISYEVRIIPASESVSTREQVENLLKQDVPLIAGGGDGAMDDLDLWAFFEMQDLIPIIKPDKNALPNSQSALRNREVKLRNFEGYKRWSRSRGYGHRWPSTEGINSAFKRIFGEQLSATSEIGLLKEASSKVWAYQRIKRYGESRG
jgi:hypothetical protein